MHGKKTVSTGQQRLSGSSRQRLKLASYYGRGDETIIRIISILFDTTACCPRREKDVCCRATLLADRLNQRNGIKKGAEITIGLCAAYDWTTNFATTPGKTFRRLVDLITTVSRGRCSDFARQTHSQRASINSEALATFLISLRRVLAIIDIYLPCHSHIDLSIFVGERRVRFADARNFSRSPAAPKTSPLRPPWRAEITRSSPSKGQKLFPHIRFYFPFFLVALSSPAFFSLLYFSPPTSRTRGPSSRLFWDEENTFVWLASGSNPRALVAIVFFA